jgi:hypothetical protein
LSTVNELASAGLTQSILMPGCIDRATDLDGGRGGSADGYVGLQLSYWVGLSRTAQRWDVMDKPTELRRGALRYARASRQFLPGADTPFTLAVLAVLAVTTVLLRWGAPGDADVLRWASTNLVNLRHHPLSALAASIFVTAHGVSREVLVFAVGSAVLERRSGLLRAAAIPLAGHVIATLVSEGGVRVAIWGGDEPRVAAWQLDIGISYLAFSAAAAALRHAPRRWRAGGLAVLAAWVLIPLARHPDLTAWGHVLSVVLGVLSWHWVIRPALRSTGVAGSGCPRGGRVAWSRTLSASAVASLAVAGLLAVGVGGSVLPVLGNPTGHLAIHSTREAPAGHSRNALPGRGHPDGSVVGRPPAGGSQGPR